MCNLPLASFVRYEKCSVRYHKDKNLYFNPNLKPRYLQSKAVYRANIGLFIQVTCQVRASAVSTSKTKCIVSLSKGKPQQNNGGSAKRQLLVAVNTDTAAARDIASRDPGVKVLDFQG